VLLANKGNHFITLAMGNSTGAVLGGFILASIILNIKKYNKPIIN
jgi:hypothetical protein